VLPETCALPEGLEATFQSAQCVAKVQFQGLAYPLGVFALRVQNLLLFAASQVLAFFASVADGRLLDAEIIAARAAYTHSLMAALVFGNSCSTPVSNIRSLSNGEGTMTCVLLRTGSSCGILASESRIVWSRVFWRVQ
jgi:hypothetical protein